MHVNRFAWNRDPNSPRLYRPRILLAGHESIIRKLLLSGAIVSREISIPLDKVSIRRKPIKSMKYRSNGRRVRTYLFPFVIPTYTRLAYTVSRNAVVLYK